MEVGVYPAWCTIWTMAWSGSGFSFFSFFFLLLVMIKEEMSS